MWIIKVVFGVIGKVEKQCAYVTVKGSLGYLLTKIAEAYRAESTDCLTAC